MLNTGTEIVDSNRADVLGNSRCRQESACGSLSTGRRIFPSKCRRERANESIMHEETYANWHKFDGVMTPLMVVRYKDGVKTMEIRATQSARTTRICGQPVRPAAPKSK